MMVVLKAMEEQGLIERAQHPRHQTVLETHLTSVGREALSAARTRAEPIEQRIAEALSGQELDTLRALLRRRIEADADTAQRPGRRGARHHLDLPPRTASLRAGPGLHAGL